LLFADDVLDHASPCVFKAKSGRWAVIRVRVKESQRLSLPDRQHRSNH
jgi:hypothetical protein